MQKQSIILLGHGSKSKDALEDFNFIVDAVKKQANDKNVFGAHMELASPSLEDVVSFLTEEERKDVVIVPYFLFNGNHIKKDIPEKIETLKKEYPGANIELATPIGKEPLMAEILLKKVNNTN